VTNRLVEIALVVGGLLVIVIAMVFDAHNPAYVARPVCEHTRGNWIQVGERCWTSTVGKHRHTTCYPTYGCRYQLTGRMPFGETP
jgi:hypothetical protein